MHLPRESCFKICKLTPRAQFRRHSVGYGCGSPLLLLSVAGEQMPVPRIPKTSSALKWDRNSNALISLRNHVYGLYTIRTGARGGAVGWGTALQVGRSQVRFSMVSLGFFIDIILPAALWPWGWLSLQQKWVPGIFPGDKDVRCVGLITLPPSCADCLEIWEPQPPGTLRAPSRPVTGLLYLLYSIWTCSSLCTRRSTSLNLLPSTTNSCSIQGYVSQPLQFTSHYAFFFRKEKKRLMWKPLLSGCNLISGTKESVAF